MPNRTLALDVAAGRLRVALVERTLRTSRILGLYATPEGCDDGDLATAFRALTTEHELRWDEVITALPGDRVTHRILTLPFRDRKRLDQTVPFELETQLPFDLDESIIDYQLVGTSGTDAVVFAALAPKAAVRDHLAKLAAAGIDPRVIDLAPLAALNLLRLARHEQDGSLALLTLEANSTAIALLRAGRLVGLRTIGRGIGSADDFDPVIRDVRWSLLALAGDGDLESLVLWVGGEQAHLPGVVPALEAGLGIAPRGLDALAIGGVPVPLRRDQAAFATPLGLALRESGDQAFGVDFRRGEFAYHREREALWRAFAGTGILALAALLLMVASFVLEGHQLEARRDAVRAEIRSLFTDALPQVSKIVSEKAQLAAEITALEKERQLYGGLAPSTPRVIDLLRALTDGVPPDVTLDLEELSVDGETMRIRGSTPSYEGVEAVKRSLAAQTVFRDIQAKDVRTSVDGQRVDFRVSLAITRVANP